MRRPLATVLVLTMVVSACSDSSDDALAAYYEEAAQVANEYETAAGIHFDTYRTALESATEETGDDIYVEASQGLFAGLAPDLDSAVAGLAGLMPPDDVETEHAAWLASAQALNAVIRETNGDLAPLSEAEAVAEILGTVNLVDLQEAYRAACRTVRELATSSGTVIACEPGESS